jgi:Creatinase/Prolidase N-terminal domain
MRRGLIARSPTELPDAVLRARLDRLRAAMQASELDVLVVYTNNTRPAGVSWLTGFVPYWSEALLVVPRGNYVRHYLVAALSNRVKSWIEATSFLEGVIHYPRIGLKAGQTIASVKTNAVVGVVDFEGLPTGIADDLREGGPGLTLRDASALFESLRATADPAELALATKAAAIAHRALAAARGDTLNEMIAAVESEARQCGAEEIYIAAAPNLERGTRFIRVEGEPALGKISALRATVSYKGTWVRLVRTFCDSTTARQGAALLAYAIAPLPAARGMAVFDSWLIEGCRLAQPLQAYMGTRLDASTAPPPGAVVSVQGTLTIGGRTVLVGAPALIGREGEAASFIVDPLFE